MEKILLVILSQLEEKDTLKYIECFEEIIKETRHVFYRPMIYMFKAKYVLHVDNNEEYAEELYGKAVTSAELLGDAGLRGECIGDFKKLPIVNCEDLAEKIRRTFENYDYYKSEIAERSKLFSNKIMCENYIKECENLLKN